MSFRPQINRLIDLRASRVLTLLVGSLLVTIMLSGCGGGGSSSRSAPETGSGGAGGTAPAPSGTSGFGPDRNETTCGGVDTDAGAGGSTATPFEGLIFRFVNNLAGLPTEREFATASSVECFVNGVAAVDYDADGDIDLFVLGGLNDPHSLHQNQGDGTFLEVAGDVGLDLFHRGSGPVFADIDGDGDLDLFIGAVAGDSHFVMRNDGGAFTDVTEESGIELTVPNTMSATFDDYDQDGDLDLFLSHHSSLGQQDTETLWRNFGDGTFESYSIQSGIAGSLLGVDATGDNDVLQDFTFTPNLSDIDGDGDRDLLMSADFGTSKVFMNNGDGTFTHATDRDVITDEAGMGGAVGDYDNDGDMDWFVSSIYNEEADLTGNRLYRNDGNGVFEDVTVAAGVEDGFWGWGSCFADFDNDGYLDLFHVNGWTGFLEFEDDPLRYFHSNGDGTFTERSADIGLTDTGQGRGIACFDADRDGDLEIAVINNSDRYLVYYRNDLDSTNHYLGVKLVSLSTNTAGIGAWIKLSTGLGSQVREVRAGSNYVSQNPSEVHFGLASATIADIEIRWPDGSVQTLQDVDADQFLTVMQESENLRLVVSQGQGGGTYDLGDEVPIQANAAEEGYYFSHWSSNNGGVIAEPTAASTTFTMPGGTVSVTANYVPGVAPGEDVSVARRWNEVLLQAIRNDFARPTVHARNLFHTSSAMYDAWSAYRPEAVGVEVPWLLGNTRAGTTCDFEPAAITSTGDVEADREHALSFATYRLIRHRFASSPGASTIRRDADALMGSLGYDLDEETTDYASGSAAALGNHIAECYIAFGLADGANEAGAYVNRFYTPVNDALEPAEPGNPNISDLNRWQPLSLAEFIDQAGNPVSNEPEFLGPEWGQVVPFALSVDDRMVYQRDGFDYWVYHDPGAPPTLESDDYKWGFALVAIWSSQLDHTDGAMVDISPASLGNIAAYPENFSDYPDFYNTLDGGDTSVGYSVNPITGEAYTPQMVPRGDYGRVLAEFWADGPDSETPPGHWFVIVNEVNEHPDLERRYGGAGAELGHLEWDVKTYFMLGGAMHDSAIAAWGSKGWYDYIRPISALRAMAERQSSDPGGASYDVDGIPLEPGYIELVEVGDPLAGVTDEHVGKIKFLAWRGPDFIAEPATDVAGVDWILAEHWWPYQRPSFVTPPFAGYVSGHSTYSRAAAEVLTALTGDPFFPGGKSGFEVTANEFLVFEDGPSVDMTLEWATYRDASDQCSLSRIWGGIHPPLDDIPGRLMGMKIGIDVFNQAATYFDGTATP